MINPVNDTGGILDNEGLLHSKEGKKERTEQKTEAVKVSIGEKRPEAVTYSKPKLYLNPEELEELKKKNEEFFEPLKRFVDNLIEVQHELRKKADNVDKNIIPEQIKKAKNALSEDGEWGAKNSAERIVDYAKMLTAGEHTKYTKVRATVEESFSTAEKRMGSLPQISRQTRDEVIKKLNDIKK